MFDQEIHVPLLKKIIIHPIIKNRDGDPHDCGNHRPIALLSHFFKLYESILNTRLINFLENPTHPLPPGFVAQQQLPLLNENMNGFRAGRNTLDNLFTLRELILEHRHNLNRKKLIFCFLDIKKCFDRVSRPAVFDSSGDLE